MSVISVKGGRLGMRQWTKDRLIQEIRFTNDAIARILDRDENHFEVFFKTRAATHHELCRYLLLRFNWHERLLNARAECERRLNDEAVRRTLGLTLDGRSVYGVEAS